MSTTNKRLALIIGNGKYQDGTLQRLIAPRQDAESLSNILSDPTIGNFEVKTLINRPVSEILQEIEVFFSNGKRDDLLLLYFSGHGIKDEAGRLFLAARDTMRDRLRSTAIPASFLHDAMDDSRARQQVLILDCCHSGAFPKGMQHKGTEKVNIGDQFKGSRGRVILTASNAIQYAFEGDHLRSIGKSKQSVFTNHLIKGLEAGEADRNNDGLISLNELYDYVHDRVTEEMPQQTPEVWQFGVEGEIIIALNPRSISSAPSIIPRNISNQSLDFPSQIKLLLQLAVKSPGCLTIITYLIVAIPYIIFQGNINDCEQMSLLSNSHDISSYCLNGQRFSLTTAFYWGLFAAIPNFALAFMQRVRSLTLAALFSSLAFMLGTYVYYLVFTRNQTPTSDFSITNIRYIQLVCWLGLMWSLPSIWMFLTSKNRRLLLLLPFSIIGIAAWNLYLILPQLFMYRVNLAVAWGIWATIWLYFLIPAKYPKKLYQHDT